MCTTLQAAGSGVGGPRVDPRPPVLMLGVPLFQRHLGAHRRWDEGHLVGRQPHPAVGFAGKLQPGRGK